jgi:antitoxin ParD1/3/4
MQCGGAQRPHRRHCSLIEVKRDDVEQRVRTGSCGSTCTSLRKLIEEGLTSGPGRALTPQRAAQLKAQALGRMG